MKANIGYFMMFFLLFGCDSQQTADEITDEQLIGVWQAGKGHTIEYKSNGTFVNKLSPDFELYGTYRLNHGVIELTDVEMIFDDSVTFNQIVIINSMPSFKGDSLYLEPVDVLRPLGHDGSNLYGAWTRTNATVWLPDKRNIAYQGVIEYYYNFFQDSIYCDYGSRFLEDSTLGYSSHQEYIYTAPYLDLNGEGYYGVEVEFNYGSMYWHYFPNTKNAFVRIK